MSKSAAIERIFNGVVHRAVGLQHGIKTVVRRLGGRSDTERWQNESHLSTDWDSRTRQIAALIAPGAAVLEFGAGRQALRLVLPDSCTYTPSDLVDRGAGTIVCDLNSAALPTFPNHDVAVFGGVLEYVNDVPRLVSHLSGSVSEIIASYAVADRSDRKRMKRRAAGWVNDYDSIEFKDIFARQGFHCDFTETWRSQHIYRFTKRPQP
jgi:hypothetical protein